MKEVKFKYYEDSLDKLFEKEVEVLSNIYDYCSLTHKSIEVKYEVSSKFETSYILELIIKEE